jgi:hypothetical protein
MLNLISHKNTIWYKELRKKSLLFQHLNNNVYDSEEIENHIRKCTLILTIGTSARKDCTLKCLCLYSKM